MPCFAIRQSSKLNLTPYSGLALVGQCCQATQVEAVIAPPATDVAGHKGLGPRQVHRKSAQSGQTGGAHFIEGRTLASRAK